MLKKLKMSEIGWGVDRVQPVAPVGDIQDTTKRMHDMHYHLIKDIFVKRDGEVQEASEHVSLPSTGRYINILA